STVVATVTAAKASLPRRFPTHRPLTSCIDACSRFASRIGRENRTSFRGIDPTVKSLLTVAATPLRAAAASGSKRLETGPLPLLALAAYISEEDLQMRGRRGVLDPMRDADGNEYMVSRLHWNSSAPDFHTSFARNDVIAFIKRAFHRIVEVMG